MDHGCAALVWPARVRCFGSGRTKNPGHIFFSPKILADTSAALVLTEEN